MTRMAVITDLARYVDDGQLWADLARRVAIRSNSQDPACRDALYHYLQAEIGPWLTQTGFETQIFENPVDGMHPILVARRWEGDDLPTLLTYGHGDVVPGYDCDWTQGAGPWTLAQDGARWFGRGTADNKGQHTINLQALKTCLHHRGGRLGYNVIVLLETGEEVGSTGLRDFCRAHRDLLRADVFVASDGPRISADRPTLYFGSRGVMNLTLAVNYREGGHHSGNWGGLLANPGVRLAHALASVVGPRGQILIEALRPDPLSNAMRQALARVQIPHDPSGPRINPDWGEPGLTPEERVYGWNTFEVLAFETGNPRNPASAIPPTAFARCQMRYVAGFDPKTVVPALTRHFAQTGFPDVAVTGEPGGLPATRLDLDTPWVDWAVGALRRTAGDNIAVLPNFGGSLPNDCFADILGLPTIWVPHSHPGCSQHAADEHILEPVTRSALSIMGGLFWDLGEPGVPWRQAG